MPRESHGYSLRPGLLLDGWTTWESWSELGCDSELVVRTLSELVVFIVVTVRC